MCSLDCTVAYKILICLTHKLTSITEPLNDWEIMDKNLSIMISQTENTAGAEFQNFQHNLLCHL